MRISNFLTFELQIIIRTEVVAFIIIKNARGIKMKFSRENEKDPDYTDKISFFTDNKTSIFYSVALLLIEGWIFICAITIDTSWIGI